MLTVVYTNTIMLWVLPNASKQSPVRIILFILSTLKNWQHPCKNIRVDEDSALENSTDVTNLIVDELKISMETTGDDASWLNGNNEIHTRSIHNMLRTGLLESNHNEKKWWCEAETPAEFHRFKLHTELDNTSPQFAWYGQNPSIHELRTFVYYIYPSPSSPKI